MSAGGRIHGELKSHTELDIDPARPPASSW